MASSVRNLFSQYSYQYWSSFSRIKWLNAGKLYLFDKNLKAGDFFLWYLFASWGSKIQSMSGCLHTFRANISKKPSSDWQLYTSPLNVVLSSRLLLGKVGINLGFAAPQLSNHICPALMKWVSRKDSHKKQLPPDCLTHVSCFRW